MLLPMLLWIALSRTALYYPIENHIIATRSAIREYRRLCLVDASAHICVFLIASLLSMVPWTVLYYRETGRLIPNSWPSETMIKNSVFLQQAIDRPWYFYLEKLLVLSPVIFIGLCVAATSAFRLFVVDFVGGIFSIVGRKPSAADYSNDPKSVREAAIRKQTATSSDCIRIVGLCIYCPVDRAREARGGLSDQIHSPSRPSSSDPRLLFRCISLLKKSCHSSIQSRQQQHSYQRHSFF
jgi:hypothetical protein